MRRVPVLIFSIVGVIALANFGRSQTPSGTIGGAVTDATGAILPGVSIVLKNLETGQSRTLLTDDEGRYIAPNLPLGSYRVEASLVGFKTEAREGIHLTVGRNAVVNFQLQIGEISEQVTVTGEAPLVNTASATFSGLVDDQKIRDLPLNGRSFNELALLTEGVTPSRSSGGGGVDGVGRGIKVVANGARPEMTNYTMDGTDLSNTIWKNPSSVSGVFLGVDTVREYQVLTHSYSAEFSSAAGGAVRIASRSGTNQLHGSAYLFHRNDNLDARNFFDPGEPPEFKRNQFGFTLGGPLVRDKTFFFGGFEALRDRLGLTRIAQVPDQNARQGVVPGRRVTVAPAVVPYLALYPVPNGRTFPDGTAEFHYSFSQPTAESHFSVKLDHNFSSADSMFARYAFYEGSITAPGAFPQFLTDEGSRQQYLTLSETHIFSPTVINEFRFGFTRAGMQVVNRGNPDPDPSLSFVPGRGFGTLEVGGVSGMGFPSNTPKLYAQNIFQYNDNLTWTRGNHQIKAGAELKRHQLNQETHSRLNGRYRFNTLADFLQGSARNLEAVLLGKDDAISGARQWIIGLYVQDDIQATRRLSLNLGLRYEFITVPVEVNGKAGAFRSFADPALTFTPPYFENPSLKNFGPRLGVAWDPWGEGKTSLRAGFGIFHEQLWSYYWNDPMVRVPPFYIRGTRNNPPFPNAVAALTASVPALEAFQFTPENPYMIQWNLGLQHQLGSQTVINAGYAGSRGIHLVRQADQNIRVPDILPDGRPFWPAGRPRRNPNFDFIRTRTTEATSEYHGFQLGLIRRFSQGLQFQGSYSLSKSTDVSSGARGSSDFVNSDIGVYPFDIRFDKGLSSFDIRNHFVFNVTYDLPGSQLSGLAGSVLGGWQSSSIVTISSGEPFSVKNDFDRARTGRSGTSRVDRPNLKPGASNNPFRGGPDEYFDPSAFELQPAGFLGNLGRNTVIGPGYANLDLSLVKRFRLSEEAQLQFRAELFNLLNRANFGTPDRILFLDVDAVNGSAGRIDETVSTSRQVQFALKLTF